MALPRRICVFCGSNSGREPAYATAAIELGQLFAELEITLIYGGACVGLMGAVADAVLSSGGNAIGVMPEALIEKEVAHKDLTELHVVSSMHERKALMADLSEAFVALPGGFGTVEELCEILTWGQLGMHQKPVGLLNINGYYDSLLEYFDRATTDLFIHPAHRELVLEDRVPREILSKFEDYQPPRVEKWIDRGDT